VFASVDGLTKPYHNANIPRAGQNSRSFIQNSDKKLCWLTRDPGTGLNALLSSYKVGAEQPLSTE
jgi:hypothetical protein